MMSRDVSRVVIVDRDAHPVGVLSLTDIIMAEDVRHAVRTVRGVLEREAGGPHAPVERIRLTASDPQDPPPEAPEPPARSAALRHRRDEPCA
jgi:hypothetical protein